MSKQKKTAGPTTERTGADREVGRAPEIDPALLDQASLGNAALQAQLGGERTPEAVSLDVVRDVAVPIVEKVGLALELDAMPPLKLDRFVQILERSGLPDDRKQELVDRLRTRQSGALSVQEALEKHLGADSEELRALLSEALDAALAGLASGHAVSDGWRVGDRDVRLSEEALQGSVTDRAAALVGDLAAALAPPASSTVAMAPAVRSICLALFLALHFEEEEEEGGDLPVELDA